MKFQLPSTKRKNKLKAEYLLEAKAMATAVGSLDQVGVTIVFDRTDFDDAEDYETALLALYEGVSATLIDKESNG
jgi:hypothetical protein